VELYLHSPSVFLAWCVVKLRDDFAFTFRYFVRRLHDVKMLGIIVSGCGNTYSPFQFFNHLTDFHEIWYERYLSTA